MDPEAAAYWQDWLEGQRDVPGLRLHTITLLEGMRTASQEENWEKFQRLVTAYSFVTEYCQGEPLLTVFENGLMYVNVYLADAMWNLGDLPRALEHIDWVMHTIQEGDQRRSQSGMVPRPNSELRYMCLGLRSCCYLEDSALFVGGSPELESTLLISEFWRLAESTTDYLRQKHGDLEGERAQMVLHGVARWEIEVCKLAERYNPSFAPLAVEFFNQRMGNHLALQLRDFDSEESDAERSAWYWDFELSKLETSGEYSRAEVLLCDRSRSSSARMTYTPGPTKFLKRVWARQVERMLASANSD